MVNLSGGDELNVSRKLMGSGRASILGLLGVMVWGFADGC